MAPGARLYRISGRRLVRLAGLWSPAIASDRAGADICSLGVCLIKGLGGGSVPTPELIFGELPLGASDFALPSPFLSPP